MFVLFKTNLKQQIGECKNEHEQEMSNNFIHPKTFLHHKKKPT